MDGDNVVLDEYIFKDLAHPPLHDKPINTYWPVYYKGVMRGNNIK